MRVAWDNGQEPQIKTFADLQPGAVFLMPGSSIVYIKASTGVGADCIAVNLETGASWSASDQVVTEVDAAVVVHP